MRESTKKQSIELSRQLPDDFDKMQDIINSGIVSALAWADIKRVGKDVKRVLTGKAVIPTVNLAETDNGGVSFTVAIDTRLWLEDQRKFFKEVYSKNLPKVKLPPVTTGFGWGVLMAPFMGTQWLFDCCRERFNDAVWKWTNDSLDTAIAHNDRDPKKDSAYSIWCRDRIEADEELKNGSYNDIVAAKIKSMTCVERLNLGVWFHWKTGKHLDIKKKVTLCAGSRYADGSVPFVVWNGQLIVDGYGPTSSDDDLRARQVISC